MATVRDTQRNRIYRAEDAFILAHPEYRNISLRELQTFVDLITRKLWWKQHAGRYSANQFEVFFMPGDRTGQRFGCVPHRAGTLPNGASIWSIDVDKGTSTRLHVLHSMTHVVMDNMTRNGIQPMIHEANFVTRYLELIRKFWNHGSPNDAVKKEFKKHLIEQHVRTKVISEETRQKQRDAYFRRMTPTEDKLRETLRSLEEM